MNAYELFPGAIVNMKGGETLVISAVNSRTVAAYPLRDLKKTNSILAEIEDLEPIQLTHHWLHYLDIPINGTGWQLTKEVALDIEIDTPANSILISESMDYIGNVAFVHSLQGYILHLTGKLLKANFQKEKLTA